MSKNDQKESRVKNAESFLNENGALVAIDGKTIDIRKLPKQSLDNLLNAVEDCQEGREPKGANIHISKHGNTVDISIDAQCNIDIEQASQNSDNVVNIR
jgi:hypothetical protein